MAAFRSSIADNEEHEKSSGEEYETDLLKVDIKPEIYAQTVYSTSQHPIGEALGRKLSSPSELGVTKDLNKSIMVQLDTTSTCNTPPDRIAQSLIPLGQTKKPISPTAKQPYMPMTTLSCGEAFLCSKLISFVLYVLLFIKQVDISLPLK